MITLRKLTSFYVQIRNYSLFPFYVFIWLGDMCGVQENGKLPTENEPKIGLSLQNVRTVKVCLSLFPNIYL